MSLLWSPLRLDVDWSSEVVAIGFGEGESKTD